MNKNFKIESMVELRAFAITKAIEFSEISGNSSLYGLMNVADSIVEYIKKDAELPEVALSPDGVLYDYITQMIDENKKADKMINEIFNESNIGPKFLVKDNNS